MFSQALKTIGGLPESQCPEFQERLVAVRDASRYIGYGLEEEMDDVLSRDDTAARAFNAD